MELKPRIVINGEIREDLIFEGVFACHKEGILEIVLFDKKSLDKILPSDKQN